MTDRIPSSYKDLREFIAYLDRRGQLRRIKAPVSNELEIAEITDRVSKSRDANYALLFENVRGHSMPVLISRDRLRGTRNVGMYRIQVYDRNTAGMHWQIHKGGTEHQRRALEQGQQRMDVAVALGGSPACIYAGSAPLPPGIDEIMFA